MKTSTRKPIHKTLRDYRVWQTAILIFSCVTLSRMVDYLLDPSTTDFSTAYGAAFGGISLALAGIIKFSQEAFTKGNEKDVD